MQCKNCGRDVKSDFKYCPYCANRLINDFEDHYGELNPPYVMPDLTNQVPDDAAFLYGRARVIPDEADAFFAPEQPAATDDSAEQPIAAPINENRPLPYEIFRPESVSGISGMHLPDLPDEEFSPEPFAPPHERFHATLPDDLPDLPEELPDDLLELPEDLAPSPDSFTPPYERFHVNLPDDLPDLPEELPDDLTELAEDFAHDPHKPPHEHVAYVQPPMAQLEWETQRPDVEPPRQHNQTMEDAPYVSMQPDISVKEKGTHVRSTSQKLSPGMPIKLLLIIFMILLGVLASFALYRFWGALNFTNRIELTPAVAASCWNQAWIIHYFL